MKRSRYLLVRAAWTVIAAWLFVSITFFFFALTPDPQEPMIAYYAGGGEAGEEAVAAYNQARNYDDPLLDRYTRWMVDYGTLDWGWSYTYDAPVLDVIVERGKITLSYLLVTALLALSLGTAIGLVSVTTDFRVIDAIGRGLSYLGFGLPSFWLAEAVVLFGIHEFNVFAMESYNSAISPFAAGNFPLIFVAAAITGLNLLAIQAHYVYSETRAFVSEEFVRTLRSAGASQVDVTRHLVRNASIPLVSLLFTEVLIATMVDVVIVERVLGVPGFGDAVLTAIDDSDLGLIIGTWMVPVLIVLSGGFVQDVFQTVLDPRIEAD